MNPLTVFNLGLGLLCFLSVFAALVLDMLDTKHGRLFTRVILFLMLLINISYLIRVGATGKPSERLWFWFVINISYFVRSLYHYRNRHW